MCFVSLQYLNPSWYSRLINKNTYFKTTPKNQWHCPAEFLSSEKTWNLQEQAGMSLAMHGLNTSAQTAGQVLGFSTETRTNDMFKQETNHQRKIIDITIESSCKVMFEKIKAYYSSLILGYLHMVLKKKSTTRKFLSFQSMYKQLLKWGKSWRSKWKPSRYQHYFKCEFLYVRWLG